MSANLSWEAILERWVRAFKLNISMNIKTLCFYLYLLYNKRSKSRVQGAPNCCFCYIRASLSQSYRYCSTWFFTPLSVKWRRITQTASKIFGLPTPNLTELNTRSVISCATEPDTTRQVEDLAWQNEFPNPNLCRAVSWKVEFIETTGFFFFFL